MVALADVRRWDPVAVEAAFTRFGTARDQLTAAEDDLHTARPPGDWLGPASEQSWAGHARLADHLTRITTGVTILRPAVADTADAVTTLRRDLARADTLASDRGFALAPDGSLTDIRPTVIPVDQHAAHQARRTAEQREILDLLEGVLRRAAEIDATLAGLLARITTDLDATAQPGGGPVTTPPAAATPQDNAAWWNGLGADGQAQVLATHPDWIGNLDGIPATARDAANRARLPTEIARLDAALADTTARWQASLAQPLPPGMEGQGETREQLTLRGEIERLGQQRVALDAIARTVAPAGRQLLLLDVSAHDAPRAAVAVGDIDRADHIAVLTPGLESTVAGDIVGYASDVRQVRDTALAALRNAGRGAETVAGVAWIGYDAPQFSTLGQPDRSVALDIAARDGGTDLARFYDGIIATRPDDPHLTALGHSYGSTTTGHALQHATGVDDAVLFGSPGAGTGDITDLNVPAGHLGVLEARQDIVADLGTFGGDTNQLDGVTNLSARDDTAPDGTPLRESVRHSDYLTPGTTSHYNIATTVAGLHDQRITGDNDGFGDWLRSPWGTS